MIGQTKIINKINDFSYNDLPHSILLLGDKGSGKHEICNYISTHYSIPLIDISTEITKDKIDDIYIESEPAIYIIDIVSASKSKKILNLQNAILKLVEEPPERCKIVILAETTNQILPTILNRCQIWFLERYSLSELKTFNNELTDYELMLLSTPGNIKSISHKELEGINKLCDNIINNISRAGISNTLSIADKINLSDEYDKYDLNIFCICLRNKLSRTTLIEAFKITKLFMEDCRILNVNKKYLFENFLLNLKGTFDGIERV